MLAQNVMHFARVLRASGLAVGPDRVSAALQALTYTTLDSRDDVKAALSATLTRTREDRPIFDEAFRIFWRDPDLESKMRALLLPQVESRSGQQKSPMANRRLAAAFFPHVANTPAKPTGTQEIQFDAALTFSPEERLRRADFETMNAAEWAEAKRVITRFQWDVAPIQTRRKTPARHAIGRTTLDFAATLRASIRAGGDVWPLIHTRPIEKPAPLVVLADVSGSMERYTRMLLHFLHAMSNQKQRVETFLFGTRLTRVTRDFAQRDVDEAVLQIERRVLDWGSGTRIGPSLKTFNREWSRRVLAQRASVLLITDGLDRDDESLLGTEMARLKRATRQLIWLNPLLRYADFEAKPTGVRAMLPHVDRFLPVHNIESLTALAAILSQPLQRHESIHGTHRLPRSAR